VYLREVSGWKKCVLSLLLIRPLKCHHCYHKFHLPWLLTLGERLTPPPSKRTAVVPPASHSYAARYAAAMQHRASVAGEKRAGAKPSRGADAA
jgi:hypothetical protein